MTTNLFAESGSPGSAQQSQSLDGDGVTVSVLDFIPVALHAGIRAATNTTALRDYIEDAIASRADDVLMELVFPPGSYYLGSNPIRVNRSNIGIVGRSAGLSSDSATANHIEIGDGVTARANINVRGLTFEKTVVSTGGYAVSMDLVTNARVERCVFYGSNKLYGGVKCHRTIRVKIINNDGENFAPNGKGVLWTGTASSHSIDLHIRDNEFYTIPTGIGLDVQDYCEGLYCRQNTFFACGAAGVSIAGASEASTLLSYKIDLNDLDSCGFGIYSNYADNISIGVNWFSANTSASIRLDSGCAGVVVTGNQIYGNGHVGIQCEADDVNIVGNLITACTDGVVLGAACVGATLSGNSINGNAGYGVNLLSNPNSVSVVGNTVRSNVIANISGGGTNLNVASNLTT